MNKRKRITAILIAAVILVPAIFWQPASGKSIERKKNPIFHGKAIDRLDAIEKAQKKINALLEEYRKKGKKDCDFNQLLKSLIDGDPNGKLGVIGNLKTLGKILAGIEKKALGMTMIPDESEAGPMPGLMPGGGPSPLKVSEKQDYKNQLKLAKTLKRFNDLLIKKLEKLMAQCSKALVVAGGRIKYVEENYCIKEADYPNDPHFKKSGTWGQKYPDQWALKRVGFTSQKKSAWNVEDGTSNPVIVAVVDTGLDWNHKDISWDNLWRNEKEIPDNGIDDDDNGYVDDLIGWNFVNRDATPWDHDGHGTFVTGIIAAATGNGAGIAGVNRGAKIMVLKALNAFGHTRASYVAEAVFYAADNGAKVINLSLGGEGINKVLQEAVDYAHAKGAVIVVAAGNDGIDTTGYQPAGLNNVITVSATDTLDKRAKFSNWGQGIDIAAPGLDILSLRGRRTDFMQGVPGLDYTARAAYVGQDSRYFRSSGTSFAAPIVAGVASLLFAKDPGLKNTDVERIVLQSATDIETPGVDQFTGYGLLNAYAALKADPGFFITAVIGGVEVVSKDGKPFINVLGSATADKMKKAWIELGKGEDPKKWKKVSKKITAVVENGLLGEIDASLLRGSALWTIRLITEHKNGKRREVRFVMDLG